MSERRRLEDRVLEALVDGHDVDWDAAVGRVSSAEDRQRVDDLRLLHRRLRRSRVSATGSTSESIPTADARPLPLWKSAVLLLALVHVAVGIAGYWLGTPDARAIPAGLPTLNAAALGIVALWLLHIGRGDPRTFHLAGLFLTVGAANAHRTGTWLWSLGHSTSAAFQPLDAIMPDAFLAAFAWGFARQFPRVQRLGRLDRLLGWGERTSVLVGASLFSANLAAHLLAPGTPEQVPALGELSRSHPSQLYWILILGLVLTAFIVAAARVRESDASERRRFSLFVAGLTLGFSPLFLVALAEAASPTFFAFTMRPDVRSYLAWSLFGLQLSVPFTTAYSVVALRVFELRLLIRRAVKYALARRTLNAVTVGSVLGLFAILYANRDSRVETLLRESYWLIALAATALLLLVLNERLLSLLDRLFFREQVAWRDALAVTTSNIRHALTAKDLEDSLSEQLDRALRARHVLLFLRRRGGELFTPVGAGRALAADSPLGKLLAATDRPLVTTPEDPRSILRWLSPADREWVADQQIGMLMPICASGGEVTGLIGLGPRQDERAFSEDDAAFVSAVASSVSLVMENQGLRSLQGAADARPVAAECAACGAVRPDPEPPCSCGGAWQDARLPWLLNEKFRLEAVLGRGGMGVVYRALDVHLNRRVALKTLPRVSPPAAVRLRKEARSMAALEHPNLAGIHGLETWFGIPVLVVEFLAGGTLADRQGDPWEPAAALRLGIQIAGALEAMHDKGLAHRDVKPSNIGVTAEGTPKLLDFGLARLAAEATLGIEAGAELPLQSHSRLAGTLLYLPPEALRGRGLGQHHDLWGLALVLYELVAGQHPYRREISEAQLRAGELPEVPALTSLVPAAPAGLVRLLRRALSREPAARPQTAAALRAEMVAALDEAA